MTLSTLAGLTATAGAAYAQETSDEEWETGANEADSSANTTDRNGVPGRHAEANESVPPPSNPQARDDDESTSPTDTQFYGRAGLWIEYLDDQYWGRGLGVELRLNNSDDSNAGFTGSLLLDAAHLATNEHDLTPRPGTLYPTESDAGRVLLGLGYGWDTFGDAGLDSYLQGLIGFRHFTMREKDADELPALDVRNDLVFGAQLNLSDYLRATAHWTGFLDDANLGDADGDYHQFFGQADVNIPRIIDIVGVTFGGRYMHTFLNKPEGGTDNPQTQYADWYAGLRFDVSDQFLIALGYQGTFGKITDEIGTELDRFGQYVLEDGRDPRAMFGHGGFGHLEFRPEDNIAIYLRAGYMHHDRGDFDPNGEFTLQAGITFNFGNGFSLAQPGQQFHYSALRPPEILGGEGGGPGAGN